MGFSPLAAALAGLSILLFGAITLPIYDKILHVELEKLIPLHNKSDMLNSWTHPAENSDAFIKFYFFNLTNPDEVRAGGKPNLVQLGPYYYDAQKVKYHVTFEGNGTVYYRPNRTMVFNKEKSNGSETDLLTTINVPLYTIMSMLEGHPAEAAAFTLLELFIKNTQIFRKLTVHEILWGYKDNLLSELAKIVNLFHIKLPIHIDGNWGFFYKKNNTDIGLFNAYTGTTTLKKYMQLSSWNKNQHVKFWNTPECNMINGTDGDVYHPFVDRSEKMYFFVIDICRSLYVTYKHQVTLNSIPLMRFTPDPELWMYDDDHKENRCFCINGSCPHNGALEISGCQGGAPVFVSQPHFLNGDYYGNLVSGLQANEELHNTFIDVEQTTGIVMEGAKRLQLNIDMQPIKNIPKTKHLRKLLYPVLWLDQGGIINQHGLQKFRNSYWIINLTVHYTTYCLVGLGVVLLIVSAVVCGVRKIRHKKTPMVTAVNENSPLLPDRSAEQS